MTSTGVRGDGETLGGLFDDGIGPARQVENGDRTRRLGQDLGVTAAQATHSAGDDGDVAVETEQISE